MIAYEILVDPGRLLRVTYRDDLNAAAEIVAMSCGYAPVRLPSDVGAGVGVAIELLWDPSNQAPYQPYYCPQQRLQRLFLAPKRLLRVKPFSV